MKLRVVSDLHLEFDYFDITPLDEDILILAGDISPKREQVIKFIERYLEKESEKDPLVLLILGNHDYYYSNIDNTNQYYSDYFLTETQKTNGRVIFLQDDYTNIDGVYFYGCTLWTRIRAQHWEIINRGIMDYSNIHNFAPVNANYIHVESRKKIETFLEERKSDDKVVLITHHLPSFRSIAPQYKHSELTVGYASNMDSVLEHKNVCMAIHGHTHTNFDYTYGGTRVICNPRGYVQYGRRENQKFNPDFIVEI